MIKISPAINIAELQKRDKYIICRKHSTLPLLIWNYTHLCQFDKAWNEYTMQTRGLITDLQGNIIARPFTKFFNLNETKESSFNNLPIEIPKVYEKLDGSLGIQYYDNEKVCIATRGSFDSDQAKWATEWISKRYCKNDFLPGYTYLYEIIFPENRIVVNYQDRQELVLLAVIYTEIGKEINHNIEAKRLGLSTPQIINNSLTELIESLKTLTINNEGFVLVYSNGFRVKMKGNEYVRLHRIISNVSSKSIWESLKNNDSLDDILQNIPDELFEWISEKRKEFIKQYEDIQYKCVTCFNLISYDLINIQEKTRKDWAERIIKTRFSNILFAMLDNKDYSQMIWKMIKPKYELPFKDLSEEI